MKLILLLLILLSTPAFATEEEAAKEFLLRCQSALEGKGHWNWNVIRVRMILEMGIEIPAIASVSVNPEIELYFTPE